MSTPGRPTSATTENGRTEFIPAWLDDLDLTLIEFRVFCRISRRGDCFESVLTMAKAFHVNHKKVRDALRSLAQRDLIIKQPRPALSDVYVVNQVRLPKRTPPCLPKRTKDSPGQGSPIKDSVCAFSNSKTEPRDFGKEYKEVLFEKPSAEMVTAYVDELAADNPPILVDHGFALKWHADRVKAGWKIYGAPIERWRRALVSLWQSPNRNGRVGTEKPRERHPLEGCAP